MYSRPSLGESIRQLRRQRSLTQSELGGELYSKSYVSAVERDKIVPSYDAMRFFAQQLEQSTDHFEAIYHQLQQDEREKHNGLTDTLQLPLETQALHHHYPLNESATQESFVALFDSILARTELYPYEPQSPLWSEDTMELMGLLPSQLQGRFSFLLGRQQLQQGNTATSLSTLENALALTPRQYHPAILDALGMNYYSRKEYHTALSYHKRALRLLDEQEEIQENRNEQVAAFEQYGDISTYDGINTPINLRLKVAFHCGSACGALGAHQQAITYYEQAYKLLSPSVDIQTLGQLLIRLGYSTYAQAYQKLDSTASPSELDNDFQRAISFIVQGRTIYQAGGDKKQESKARLLQASVLLDMSTWKRHYAQQQAEKKGQPIRANYTSLLDDTEEQCRQVLLLWLPSSTTEYTASAPADAEVYLYSAMVHMVLAFAQAAEDARLGSYSHTERRSFALAAHYCQQLLNTLDKDTFPWSLAHELTTTQRNNVQYRTQSLPQAPYLSTESHRHALSLAIIYYAAAIVSEVLGRKATHPDYIYDAYHRSDEYIRLTLDKLQIVYEGKVVDTSYIVRYYQRCIALLETRETVAETQGVSVDGTLRHILKDGLQRLTIPLL